MVVMFELWIINTGKDFIGMLLVIDIHLFYYAKNANAINIYMFPSHLENYMHGLSDYWALDRGKGFFFSFL